MKFLFKIMLIKILLLSTLFHYHCEPTEDYRSTNNDCVANDTNCDISTVSHTTQQNPLDCDCDDEDIFDQLKHIYDENVNASLSTHVNTINDTFERLENLVKLGKKLFVPNKSTFGKVVDLFTRIELSDKCYASVVASFSAFQNNELWPFKFIDSTGGLPSGIYEPKFSSFGDYDQCIDIESDPIGNENWIIYGQYCLVKFILPYPQINSYREGDPVKGQYVGKDYAKIFNLHHIATTKRGIELLNIIKGRYFRFGICMPSECDPNQLEKVLNKYLFPITKIPIEIGNECYTKNKPHQFDRYQIISILIISTLTLFVISSTVFELYLKFIKRYLNYTLFKLTEPSESKRAKLLDAFSLIKNTKSLFEPSSRFSSLDTIRLLIIINVFVVHIYLFTPILGLITLKKIISSIPVKLLHYNRYFFLRSPQIVDALFTMSGFILSYGLLGKLAKTNGKFSYTKFICLRWIRFAVPTFGSFLFFYILPSFGDGPVWDLGLHIFMPSCKATKSLLYSALFLNNFYEGFDLSENGLMMSSCNPPTWFISALFQLHAIAPLLIILYYKNARIAIYVNFIAILLGLFLCILPYYYGIKPYSQHIHIESFVGIAESWQWYHNNTNGYVSSFFVGIFFGYWLRKNVKISQTICVSLWIIALSTIAFVYIWNNMLWNLEPVVSDYDALLWFSMGKLFSSLAFAWIYFACCSGRGGIVNGWLSWHGFQPLVKLSFGIFMMHIIVVIHRIFTVRETFVMTDSVTAKNVMSDLIICTGLAYLYYMLIECPFSNIIAIVMKPKLNNVKIDRENKQSSNIILQKHISIASY